MKKLFFLLALIAGIVPAMAADMAIPVNKAPPLYGMPSWTGPYLDGYFQYGANITNTTLDTGETLADISATPHGPGVGGALGYNFEIGNGFVLGARADISYANMSGTGQIGGGALSLGNATNYLGNLDALLGFKCSPDGRLLCYGVGGFAFGGAKPNLNVATLSAAANDTSTGWNVGAGLRYRIDQHWGVFIEGDYYQLGDRSLSLVNPSDGATIATSTAKYRILTQKGGITFNF